jgi:hypothetical protein
MVMWLPLGWITPATGWFSSAPQDGPMPDNCAGYLQNLKLIDNNMAAARRLRQY